MCDSLKSLECSLLGSSVHGISQAKILEWVAISFSGALPDSGIKPMAPALQADSLPLSCQGSPSYNFNYHFKGQNSKYSHTESY